MNASKILFLCVLFASGLWAAEAPEIAELRANASAGEVGAQFELGERYLKGNGVVKNPWEATRWFTLAAEQIRRLRMDAESGDAVAQTRLGVRYELGQGVSRDLVEASKWFALAAAQGNEFASARLSHMKPSGEARGVESESRPSGEARGVESESRPLGEARRVESEPLTGTRDWGRGEC